MTESAVNDLLIGLVLLIGAIVLSALGYLWSRWMMRQEQRLDRVEDEQRVQMKTGATRDELAALREHLDERFDRVDERLAHHRSWFPF